MDSFLDLSLTDNELRAQARSTRTSTPTTPTIRPVANCWRPTPVRCLSRVSLSRKSSTCSPRDSDGSPRSGSSGTSPPGNFALEPVHAADLIRIAELVARYRDFPLGSVDAYVVAAAERRGIVDIATLDHCHFRVVRPAHTRAFQLLP